MLRWSGGHTPVHSWCTLRPGVEMFGPYIRHLAGHTLPATVLMASLTLQGSRTVTHSSDEDIEVARSCGSPLEPCSSPPRAASATAQQQPCFQGPARQRESAELCLRTQAQPDLQILTQP